MSSPNQRQPCDACGRPGRVQLEVSLSSAGSQELLAAIRQEIRRLDAPIRRALAVITNDEENIMATVAEVAADFDKYKTDVAAAFARLQASIDAGNTDGQALADLDTAIKGADADANAEDPAPVVTPPVDTPPVDGTPVDDGTDAPTAE